MSWKIPLFKIYWDEEDLKSVTNIIKRGSYWATGPEIQEFDEKISDYVGTKYAVTFNSGTSALHALLLAYDIKRGDEVIVPSFTFIATANAPLFVGAKPIFAEIEDRTYGLDPEDVEKRITSKTKAIMPIHYGGCPCLIKELGEIAEDHNLLLIEDAAESLGAKIEGEKIGTFGDSTLLSFCQNKIISTGEGGAIVTDSKRICEKMEFIRSHGRLENSSYFDSTDFFDYVQLGYNFRMSSLTAALGISQLSKADTIIKMRRKNAEYLHIKLSNIPEVQILFPPDDYFSVYQLYTIRLSDTNTRDKLKRFLADNGIMTKVYFDPVHLTSFYRELFGYHKGYLPITEQLSERVLTLPMYPELATDEIDYIVEKIKEFFEV